MPPVRPREKFKFHADKAEEFLKKGTYQSDIATAQVHATLAAAYATLAISSETLLVTEAEK